MVVSLLQQATALPVCCPSKKYHASAILLDSNDLKDPSPGSQKKT